MPKFFKSTAGDFDSPTAVPAGPDQTAEWQAANRDWWASHPMSYEWGQEHGSEVGSREYFEAIDRTFFDSARTYLGGTAPPFAGLIPYDALASMDVLEIGVGAGSHASLLAKHARSFTGIDLTDEAVALTQRRFDVFDLAGSIRQMDAEKMDFRDGSFDFIWSWGVIHHSANTAQILTEMRRVLRPGGCAVVMVYHRSVWWYYVVCGLFHGVMRGNLLRTRSLHKTVQASIDGAIARFYTAKEWSDLAADSSLPVESVTIYGDKVDMVPLPAGKLKNHVLRLIPDSAGRFFLHRLRQGYFLVASHRR